jgi:hypothetical protein
MLRDLFQRNSHTSHFVSRIRLELCQIKNFLIIQDSSPDFGALYREDCAKVRIQIANIVWSLYLRQIPRIVPLPQADNTGGFHSAFSNHPIFESQVIVLSISHFLPHAHHCIPPHTTEQPHLSTLPHKSALQHKQPKAVRNARSKKKPPQKKTAIYKSIFLFPPTVQLFVIVSVVSASSWLAH